MQGWGPNQGGQQAQAGQGQGQGQAGGQRQQQQPQQPRNNQGQSIVMGQPVANDGYRPLQSS